MQITKLISPAILSVLFSTSDEKEVITLYEFYQDLIFETQKEVANQYLREHGVTEQEIEKYFGAEQPQNEKISNLLQSQEMINLYYETYNALVDSIYNQQTPKLSPEEIIELNKTIEQERKIVELQKDQMGFHKEFSSILRNMISSGQVTQQQVEEALGKAYDEKFGNDSIQESTPAAQQPRVSASPILEETEIQSAEESKKDNLPKEVGVTEQATSLDFSTNNAGIDSDDVLQNIPSMENPLNMERSQGSLQTEDTSPLGTVSTSMDGNSPLPENSQTPADQPSI